VDDVILTQEEPINSEDLLISDTLLALYPYQNLATCAPFHNRLQLMVGRLADAYDLTLPNVGKANDQAAWFAADQWIVYDIAPAQLTKTIGDAGAVTDQSDGWTAIELCGPYAVDVLARACPLDLRDDMFPAGSAARTELFHMQSHLTRHQTGFRILIMRSFARTAWHDLSTTLKNVAAR